MKRSFIFIFTLFTICFLAQACSNTHQPLRLLRPLLRPAPKTSPTNRVGPIGPQPLACSLNADITFEGNSGAPVVCVFSLPPVPVVYTLECQIQFVVTGGTTVSIDVWPSASPSTPTNFSGIMYTGAGSLKQVTTVTAAGDTPIIGASGNNFTTPGPLTLSGTWPASATAETFEVLMEGQGVTGTVKAGSFCRMQP